MTAFLDLADPSFSANGPEVRAAREQDWWARTDYGIAVLRYAEVRALLADHPSIEEVAVVGVQDDDFGQRLRAFVVVCVGEELSEDDVRTHVRDNLARFKVPRDVVFLEELPRNATGKVLKRVL